jgi:hypothetical protein
VTGLSRLKTVSSACDALAVVSGDKSAFELIEELAAVVSTAGTQARKAATVR